MLKQINNNCSHPVGSHITEGWWLKCVELEKLIQHSKHIKDEWEESKLVARSDRSKQTDSLQAFLGQYISHIHSILRKYYVFMKLLRQWWQIQLWPAVKLWHQNSETKYVLMFLLQWSYYMENH